MPTETDREEERVALVRQLTRDFLREGQTSPREKAQAIRNMIRNRVDEESAMDILVQVFRKTEAANRAFRTARNESAEKSEIIQHLQKVVGELSEPPAYPATITGPVEHDQVMVSEGGTLRRVTVPSSQEPGRLTVGTRVMLSAQRNAILGLADGAAAHAETGRVSRILDETRVLAECTGHECVLQVPPRLSGSLTTNDAVLFDEGVVAEILPPPDLPPASASRTTFDDIGGQDEAIRRLTETANIILDRDRAAALGLKPGNVLLRGKPGNGKTMLAAAFHNYIEQEIPGARYFESPPFKSMWYGRTEKAISDFFAALRQAAAAAPYVVAFLDEADGLLGSRDHAGGIRGPVQAFLREMSQLHDSDEVNNVTIILATNRSHALSHALLRAGRLDTHIYVPPPRNTEAVQAVLRCHFPDTLDYCDHSRELLIRHGATLLTDPSSPFATIGHLLYSTGEREPVAAADLVSGAMLAEIARRVKLAAFSRSRETENAPRRIQLGDFGPAALSILEERVANLDASNLHRILDTKGRSATFEPALPAPDIVAARRFDSFTSNS